MALSKEATNSFFDWLTRGCISILLCLAAEIRSDVKFLNVVVPVIQQQIIDIKQEEYRLRDKIFAEYRKEAATKEEEIYINKLLNFTP